MGRERGWGTWLGGGGATGPRKSLWGVTGWGKGWEWPTCLVFVVIVLRYQYGSLYICFVKMQSTKNSLDGFAVDI